MLNNCRLSLTQHNHRNSAEKVIISAPGKGKIPQFVMVRATAYTCNFLFTHQMTFLAFSLSLYYRVSTTKITTVIRRLCQTVSSALFELLCIISCVSLPVWLLNFVLFVSVLHHELSGSPRQGRLKSDQFLVCIKLILIPYSCRFFMIISGAPASNQYLIPRPIIFGCCNNPEI
jgi:hypothetical protein